MNVAQMAWQDTGYLSYSPSEELLADMARSAREGWDRYPRAARVDESNEPQSLTFSRDCVISSPQRASFIRAGQILESLARCDEVMQLVNRLANRELVPVKMGYKYYNNGDYLGLHTDIQQCDITITFAISESIESIDYFPEMFRSSRADLVRRFPSEDIFPDGGTRMSVTNQTMNVFAGHDIPHARRPHSGLTVGIATLCYFAL